MDIPTVTKFLKKFLKDSVVDGKGLGNLTRKWIIDVKEAKALQVVIDLLEDCT